jgi:hypothetical protein
MMLTLLLQMKIFMFGQALLGITLVRLSDLRAQLVQRARDKQALLELLERQVRKDLQAPTELLELTVRLAQLAQQALVKPVRLVQLV